MNAKETELNRIIDAVVSCCATSHDGRTSLTRKDILGNCRSENAVMTRCILVTQILAAGYSIGTVAFLFNRSMQSVRHLRKLSEDFRVTSRAYRIAEEEVTQRLSIAPQVNSK